MDGGEGGEGSVKMEECKQTLVYMWGYLPGASTEKAPILSPVPVTLPDPISAGDSWRDVCGGGCGFAMAISGSFSILFSILFCNILYLIIDYRPSSSSFFLSLRLRSQSWNFIFFGFILFFLFIY